VLEGSFATAPAVAVTSRSGRMERRTNQAAASPAMMSANSAATASTASSLLVTASARS